MVDGAKVILFKSSVKVVFDYYLRSAYFKIKSGPIANSVFYNKSCIISLDSHNCVVAIDFFHFEDPNVTFDDINKKYEIRASKRNTLNSISNLLSWCKDRIDQESKKQILDQEGWREEIIIYGDGTFRTL